MAISTVYQLRAKVRAEESKPEVRKKIIVSADQMAVAAKLGLSAEDFIKGGVEGGFLKYADEPVTEPSNVDAILDSRAKDYGKFIDGAEVMQMIKRIVHNYIEARGTQLAFDQREALDMIVHKMGRIINGNPDKVDSWRDIAGYATLVADRLEGNAR